MSEIKALHKTPNFWEYGAKTKIPYCQNCKSFEGVTCIKKDHGLIRTFYCPQCKTQETYEHTLNGKNHI